MSDNETNPETPAPSPAAQKLAKEHGIDTDALQGSGEGGRLLQRDVMAALANLAEDTDGDEREAAEPGEPGAGGPPSPPPQVAVEEADLGRLLQLIERWGPAFEARHGLELGLRSFVVKAVVDALAAVPEANVHLHGERAEPTQYFDVAVTTPGPRGERPPVLRSPQRKSFAEIEGELARFERQVADDSLPVEAETGAVVTVHERRGLLLSTLPLEAPQCVALGVHRIRRLPRVVDGAAGPELAPRPVCALALAWEPRALDAGLAARLLTRVREGLEHPERLWLEV